ncbi:MAG: dTDP-3-amino-3,6-dideoxy-alpha-D-galactopyranose 3-N-acetyltransferase [Candidatus Dichloromethanomonas elyunquensis]|nr:MAG: dTDP-3-amino-3,6-dideoxy-alpha-D-galactopyranose 3-N-acetyltransferase [Candidatus Dichloromethanomonas elyunquensis]
MKENLYPGSVIADSAIIGNEAGIAPFCVIGENAAIGRGTSLSPGCVLSEGVLIGKGVRLGCHVTLGEKAVLEDGVTIGDHTAIGPGTVIGEGTYIGSNSTIGRPPKAASTSTVKNRENLPPLRIGRKCTIGCSAVIYAGTVLEDEVFVGDRALIREHCSLAQKVVVGSGSAVENHTQIGAFTKIQTGSYITAYMEIEDRVFIAPMVTTTNDNFMGRTEKRFQYMKGATIRRGARIGGGAILLPGLEVAEESFIAAGSLVTKDTPPHKVVKGFPAKAVRDVPEEELLENNT